MTGLSDALLPLVRPQLEVASEAPRLVFISGAQGIGKSTALKAALSRLDANVCGLGIDDFYLPKADRPAACPPAGTRRRCAASRARSRGPRGRSG